MLWGQFVVLSLLFFLFFHREQEREISCIACMGEFDKTRFSFVELICYFSLSNRYVCNRWFAVQRSICGEY